VKPGIIARMDNDFSAQRVILVILIKKPDLRVLVDAFLDISVLLEVCPTDNFLVELPI
jgi:hypothetical protein